MLELTGQHKEAQHVLTHVLKLIPQGDTVHYACVQRQIGQTLIHQRENAAAMDIFDQCITGLEAFPMKQDDAWWREWIDVQLERITVYYWQNRPEAMQELGSQIKPFLQQRANTSQLRLFAVTMALMELRRGRYTISDAALAEMYANLPSSDEWGYTVAENFSHFGIGFVHLWHGDLVLAEEIMHRSLADAEQLGDVTTLARALAYLTVVYRKQQDVEKVRHYARRTLETALIGEMDEYIGSAYGHQAWVALREGYIEQTIQLSKDGYALMKAVPIGQVFIWIMLWPLVFALLASGQLEQAMRYLKILMAPTQQPQPGSIETQLELAVDAWEGGDAEAAEQHLFNACENARQFGYV